MNLADLNNWFMAIGQLVSAATLLMLALKPFVLAANKGRMPAWLQAVISFLDKAAGPFALNGKPISKK